MGKLVNGQWDTSDGANTDASGAFQRQPVTFRNWITPDGAAGPTGRGGFAAESGRYHLYVSRACPWAHRTIIYRSLKGLAPHISMDVVHPHLDDDGWTFATDMAGATGDSLGKADFLRDIYLRADPGITARVTVPVLWDKQEETIVSNESAEIIRMFNSAFNGITGDRQDFCPPALLPRIDTLNTRIYDTLNNGVYRCGFARSQEAYDAAVADLFDTLDWLEERLSRSRYLTGDTVTEADWRLFPTLVRFDAVYNLHFKCSRNRIVDFPNLWAYARDLYQWPGIAETVDMTHIREHYYWSHTSINPNRIVPMQAAIDWDEPHRRKHLSAA